MRTPLMILCLAASVALTGCATAVPSVEVTRFHRISPAVVAVPGSFRIVAGANDGAGDAAGSIAGAGSAAQPSLSWQVYAAAVARQMVILGYSAAHSGDAAPAYTITLAVTRDERESARPSPVSVGVGGSTGSYGSGLGVGVGVNLNSLLGSGTQNVVATRMAVRITRAGDALPLWEGRAETQAGVRTPAAQPGIAADKLATAMFRDFPGQSGSTIIVP